MEAGEVNVGISYDEIERHIDDGRRAVATHPSLCFAHTCRHAFAAAPFRGDVSLDRQTGDNSP